MKAAGLARSTFYYYVKQFGKTDKNSSIKAKIVAIYHQHKGRYGYRSITSVLKNCGMVINHKKVARLMKECKIKSVVRIKKYKSYRKGTQSVEIPNLLNREFKASSPHQKWVTDVTEFKVAGQKLYLSPIMDLYNGEIISYNLSSRPSLKLVMDMLKKALRKLPAGFTPIVHSDQGWQYKMLDYQQLLGARGINQSMSRKGNCLDNAVIENFFGILKSEMFYLKEFTSTAELEKDIATYINYYNNKRVKHRLNGLSPVQYRTKAA